uniref:Uncharacterized protein n=1 Tax=Alexandrium catenella TaxID=2925 RepID=A0A7S1S341_ALECA
MRTRGPRAAAALALALSWAAPCLSRSAGDEVVLVQQASVAERHASSAQAQLTRLGSRLALESGVVPPETCDRYPAACKAPFNCHMHTHRSVFKDMTQKTDGHPNPNAWCHTPYLKFAIECIIDGDHVKAAHSLYDVQSEKVRNMDAQYCFAAGHCNTSTSDPERFKAFNRSNIGVNTTIQEMEEECNRIYGEVWKHKALTDFFHANADGMGKKNEYAQMACAMGNWHCDATYCREFYCHDEVWSNTYWYKARPGGKPNPHYPPPKK